MQYEFFIPAETTDEAIGRIHALAGTTDTGRGEKRAIVALRDALGLDVDVVATNAVMGAAIAAHLGMVWEPETHILRHKITLHGLNQLLYGATLAYQRGELRRVDHTPATLTGAQWHKFQPARNKLEAVTRIAALTDAPSEWLGPGSKEHKSVLIHLAAQLFPDLDTRVSKTRLAAQIAQRVGVEWTDQCYSTGETISLEGLNVILAGAELHLERLGIWSSTAPVTPAVEGDRLAWALRQEIAAQWDARESVQWMASQGVRGANDNEWQGFFFEAVARNVLARVFVPPRQPPRVRYGNTTFDYALNYVWDLKVHTAQQVLNDRGDTKRTSDVVILNDAVALQECVREQGLGFLVLSGSARMDDDGSFVAWHRQFKGTTPAASNSGRSRMRKRSFAPMMVEAFWIDDEHLTQFMDAGCLWINAQGRQARSRTGEAGSARAEKFHVDLAAARNAGMQVAVYAWP